MENARLFTAIVLSMLVFVVWNHFFVGKQKVEPSKKTLSAEQPVAKAPELHATEQAGAPPQAAELQKNQPARSITVNTPLYTVKISERGAEFKSFVLKNYRQKLGSDAPLYEMIPPGMRGGTVRLGFAERSVEGLQGAVFRASLDSDSVDIGDEPKEVAFSWRSPQGFVVEKKFLFSPETYMIGLNVTLTNGSSQTVRDKLFLSLWKPAGEKGSRMGFEGPSAFINNKVEEVKTKKIKKQHIYDGKLTWISIQGRYFMSAIIPDQAGEASMRLFLHENDLLENQYVQPERVLDPGSRHVFKYKLFLGPKSLKLLKKLDYDLDKAVNFGWFDFLAKPFVWIMDFLYVHFVANYGVAIIILTIISKIVLWPLGNISYKSMAQMKKIQPEIAKLKEKHGDDKKKMNAEMMHLYKAYKVNPLGGCLPMLVQIPVFFALYRMLYGAIELRHAPFFGWITDLSAPDRLFRFDVAIPFMQPPYGIPVLTIIMGATQLIQQKMSPPPGDPAQAKMMMLMPLVFTVIFINFSSGLVLYWLINNILSIAQQYYVSKKRA